jgi:hypothetical protein
MIMYGWYSIEYNLYYLFILLFILSQHIVGRNRTNFEYEQEKEELTKYIKIF